jgi:UDP-N-acetylglucosamine 2-epimerase (non-hydrolysing)
VKICVVMGTRPEIIKMSPVIRECHRQNLDYFVIHTGQHYSYEMDALFFEEMKLPQPKYKLNIGSGSHAEETGKMLIRIEGVLIEEKPDIVLVLGDTNTVLAGALAASKLRTKVGHIEAGMRSYDRNMPEEVNRVLTDHISDYLFAVTDNARNILIGEGLPGEKVFVTDSTLVEAVSQHIDIASRRAGYQLDLKPSSYFLVTSHREENVDIPERLGNILDGLAMLYDEFKLPIIYPIHPRTGKNLNRFGLNIPAGVEIIKPVGFLEFLQLERNASLILTDSGGVQMEACILHVPCITLRQSTEWVETVEIGANILAGCEPGNILNSARKMLERSNEWQHPFGDGTAASQTIEIITAQKKGVMAYV